jgi:ferredoxin-NADP reductase
VTHYLSQWDHLNQVEVYICGGGEMIDQVLAILKQKNINKDDIHFERYN